MLEQLFFRCLAGQSFEGRISGGVQIGDHAGNQPGCYFDRTFYGAGNPEYPGYNIEYCNRGNPWRSFKIEERRSTTLERNWAALCRKQR